MRILSFVVCLLGASAVPLAQSASVLSDIAKAVEQLQGIADSPAPTLDRVETAARAGCNAISRLMEDKTFLPALEKTLKEDGRAADLLRNDLGRFAGEFAVWEMKQLVAMGATPEAAGRLLATVAAVRQQAKRADLSPPAVHLMIKNFGDVLCSISKQIQSKQIKDVAARTRFTWYVRFAGVATVVANVAAGGGTAGYSLLSVLLGVEAVSYSPPEPAAR